MSAPPPVHTSGYFHGTGAVDLFFCAAVFVQLVLVSSFMWFCNGYHIKVFHSKLRRGTLLERAVAGILSGPPGHQVQDPGPTFATEHKGRKAKRASQRK